jgi:hypothetical protein
MIYTIIEETKQSSIVPCIKTEPFPDEISKLFEKKYPKLLETIKPYIKSQNINISDELLDEINSWWD